MFRPFKTVEENDLRVTQELVDGDFKDGDTLYHLGDVIQTKDKEKLDRYRILLNHQKSLNPNSKFILIKGNYDIDDEYKIEILDEFFDEVHEAIIITNKNSQLLYLEHYPINVAKQTEIIPNIFGITGHIHSLWKVQEKMINVGVDAWHFKYVSMDDISFTINAIENHYDENVFPTKTISIQT